ncbi:hypothetical protein STEG23_017840, partial [Scotinomys teguina]
MGSPRREQHISLTYPKMTVFIPGNTKRSVPDRIQIPVLPAKKSLGTEMYPGNLPIESFAGSCILPSRPQEDQNVAATGVAKTVFKQDGRKRTVMRTESPPGKTMPPPCLDCPYTSRLLHDGLFGTEKNPSGL